jgi:hypothetical protein
MNLSNQQELFPHLTRQLFNRLANHRDLHCISIYLPYESKDKTPANWSGTPLDLQLHQVAKELEQHGFTATMVSECLSDLRELTRRADTAMKNGDSLAVFISKKNINGILIPRYYPLTTYIHDHFYLLPLTPLFNDHCQFLALFVHPRKSRLFLVKNHRLHRILVMKNSFTEKTKRLEPYYLEVNASVINNVANNTLPLVLVGTEKNLSLYSSFNSYRNQHEEQITLPRGKFNEVLVRKKIIEFANQYNQKNKVRSTSRFQAEREQGKALNNVNEIVTQAAKGKVYTLFVAHRNEVFGEYDAENDYVLAGLHKEGGASLSNIAAVQTILHNGNVYLMDQEQMPDEKHPLNALMA